MPTNAWWRRLNAERAADPDHWSFKHPDLDWRPPMEPNLRAPIYRELQQAMGRPLTPAERDRLDAFLDTIDIPRRFR